MIPPELLLQAYAEGVFPMSMENGEIGWFSPDPRGIIPLETFHIPHGLKRTLNKNLFRICIDHDFEAVMRACAKNRDTWISEDIIASYTALHRLGFAHSVETWNADGLVGGLYGVSLGGAFFGESMFHHATDASKVTLVALVQHLRERGYTLLDTQWITPHLATFGATNIPKKIYLQRLRAALKLDCNFTTPA
jgi:leucyl/phenylalanyl-tRNA--protein transferase